MEMIMEVLNYLLVEGPMLLSAVVAVLAALVLLFLRIPGDQPEKALQGVVDFLAKFSKK